MLTVKAIALALAALATGIAAQETLTLSAGSAGVLTADRVSSTRLSETPSSQTAEEIVSEFVVTVTASGSTFLATHTVTLLSSPPSASPSSTASSSSTNRGAIAGGVVGAVVVAIIAVIVFMHFKNKRSSTHWRNRPLPLGRWRPDADQKSNVNESASPENPYGYSSRPFDGSQDTKQPIPPDSPTHAPPAPIFVRANRRPTPPQSPPTQMN